MTGARAAALLAAALLAACATVPDPDYRNPVLDADFPDPAVLRAPDGWYYAYATQTRTDGRWVNLQVARSRDLARWTPLGDALPEKPHWAAGKQNFWAPHVVHDAERGRYVMYYSAEPDAGRGKCLAVAVSREPQGPFADSGAPLACGDGIEHIDPMAFDDPGSGRHLLIWGSGGAPIRARELAPDRLGFLPGSAAVELLAADPARPYRALIEGAWMIRRRGWYYLFYSGDRCCGRAPRYAVMVARARAALGPFEHPAAASGSGGALLEADTDWLAPGHVSVAEDGAGDDWLLYHAYRVQDFAAGERRRVMLLRRLDYESGWPLVRRAPRAHDAAPR